MKYLISPLFFLLMISNIYSQQPKTVYVDEGYDEITKNKFNKLLKSNLYDIAETIRESIIYKKIWLKKITK